MHFIIIPLLFMAGNIFTTVAPFPFVIESLEKEFSEREDEEQAATVKPGDREISVREFVSGKTEEVQSMSPFPITPFLRKRVDFWISVYTRYSSREVIIHDSEYPSLVYEVVDVNHIIESTPGYRRQLRKINKIINRRKRYYRGLLIKLQNSLNAGKLEDLSDEERKLFNRFEHIDEKDRFVRATWRKRMRMQFGQRDRFIEGIRVSGNYNSYIEDILKDKDVPKELDALIFVESMFNLKAYSRVGAAGIWQFMRSTGKKFLEISYAVDERRDPIISTLAAAKLLKLNYERLKSWPLAVTAYNHGPRGMLRAAGQVGSGDLDEIIKKYRSRTFGFASKNFYAEFLAALEVKRNSEKYFGKIKVNEEVSFKEFVVPDFLSLPGAHEEIRLTIEEIRELNPSLKPEVFSGHARIPKGFRLRVPAERFEDVVARYEKIPTKYRYREQKRRKYYRVRRGDSLWTISRRHRVSLTGLMNLNGITNVRRIRPGQVLVLP